MVLPNDKLRMQKTDDWMGKIKKPELVDNSLTQKPVFGNAPPIVGRLICASPAWLPKTDQLSARLTDMPAKAWDRDPVINVSCAFKTGAKTARIMNIERAGTIS